MRIEPELTGCSIVLLGHFNPAIFSPSWFALKGIVGEDEAKAAEISIIHPEIAAFKLGVMTVSVEPNRFSVDSSEAPWVKLSDFVVKTFGEVLGNTPVTQLGINRVVHFSVGSTDEQHRIGRLIAPIAPWGEWGKEVDKGVDAKTRGGVRNIVMLNPRSEGEISGHTQVSIQPSLVVSNNAGIYMAINDDFVWPNRKLELGCEDIMRFLAERFEKSVAHSDWIVDQIMALKA